MKVIRPPALQSDRRDINVGRDNLADALRQIDPINAGFDARLVELEHFRVTPDDDFDRMVWSCDDAAGSTILRNIGPEGGALAITGSVSLVPGGYVFGQCARVSAAAVGTYARTSETWTTAPPSASLSAWIRVGEMSTAANVIGNVNAAGNATFRLSIRRQGGTANNLLQLGGEVNVGGVAFAADAAEADCFSCGDWHHVGMAYDGEQLLLYVDGIAVAVNAAMSGAINWTLGAAPRTWQIGAESASIFGFRGRIQDVRVMNVARPESWFTESYRRGVGLYREAA